MATKINFYINNTLVNPPRNWKELGIEVNFDKGRPEGQQRVTITDFEFVRENNDLILKAVRDGLTTGVGVFEGVPFRIEVDRPGEVLQVVFDGYLDLKNGATFSRVFSNIKAVENYSIDWLNDVADGFTFRYLYEDTPHLHQSDIIQMPYVLNSVPNYKEAAITVLSVYVLVKEIKDAIQRIAEFVADMPVFYVFSSYIKLILYILYLIILIIALIKLIKQMFLFIIQPVKYHNGMTIKKQLEAGCAHLGLILKCPVLETAPYINLVHLPAKYYNPVNTKENQILGFTDPTIDQKPYYEGTFGSLLRDFMALINGKVFFNGNELWVVRKDFSLGNSQFQLAPVYNPDFRLNTDEFNSNMVISFQTDFSDKNTIQDYLGTSFQMQIQPQRVVNQSMVLMTGLEEISIPWALAARKNELTVPEKILDAFLQGFSSILGALVDAANAVIDVLNTVISKVNDILDKLSNIGIKLNFNLPDIPSISMPDFSDNISNRKGMLMIENDSFNIPKAFILAPGNAPKNNKIDVSNRYLISARYLFDNFYSINTFLSTTEKPNGSQYFLKSIENHPFLFKNYLQIKQNNFIFTNDGKEGLIDSLKWNIHSQKADINYRINERYTNNLTATFYEPDGT